MLGRVSTQVRGGVLVIADVPDGGGSEGPERLGRGPRSRPWRSTPGGRGVLDVSPISNHSLAVTFAGSGVVEGDRYGHHLSAELSGSVIWSSVGSRRATYTPP